MRVSMLKGTPDPEEVVCRAARGDYSNEWVGPDRPFGDVMAAVEGDTIEDKKRTLLNHLMRSGHWGPFEHPQVTFAVEGVSRACMAQFTRHRHASFDVMSLRYVDPSDGTDLFTYPPSFEEDETVARDGVADIGMDANDRLDLVDDAYSTCREAYEELVDAGVPKEDARMVLPIGTKVNLTFSMNARALMHVLDMRLKADAQWEVRDMCDRLMEDAKEWMPHTFRRYDEMRPNKIAP